MLFPGVSRARVRNGWARASHIICSSAMPNGTMSRSPEPQHRRGVPRRLSSPFRRLVGSLKPDAARFWRRRLEGRKRPVYLLMDVMLCIAFLVVMWWLFRWSKRPHQASEEQLVWGLGPIAAPWAVLVQHEGAASRLDKTILEEERLARCGGGKSAPMEACKEPLILAPHMLPAWTLHAVDVRCPDCTDIHTAEAAVRGQYLAQRYGVFATSSAPLGRVGPMLLAMASVTDDLDVRAELRRWEWLRHVYGEGFPTVGDGAEAAARPRSPYLAVMGIPSTDQPARVALREAQRKTWLGYQEVARGDNGFTGALLQLYLFAAVEPAVPVEMAADARTSVATTVKGTAHTSTSASLCHNTASLLPSVREYSAASCALAAESAAADDFVVDIERRRVGLRHAWQYTDVVSSPCDRVVRAYPPVEGSETSLLAYLSRVLSLPVTPAFTSPAEYICCASSALWQEALAHRNVVWVDMMTDRRPTTNKRLGDTGNWGLAVEVGMSQKLILWLEYAYHAFPTVPFIIKGDDDSYVKVPQFLSDVRYVMSGMQARQPPPPPRFLVGSVQGNVMKVDFAAARAAGGTVARLDETRATSAEVNASSTECAYWGGLYVEGAPFNAGMMFTLHRLLVRVLLEPDSRGREADVVLLGVTDYDRWLFYTYRAVDFQWEDVMIGTRLRARLERAKEICRNNRVWYVKEGLARFHDVHRGRLRAVTWSTVVAHRCTPADYYYLHHFFQNELQASVNVSRRVRSKKAVAREVARWVAEQRRTMGPGVVGWDGLPDVQWVRDLGQTPGYDMAEADGVPVYRVEYEALLRREMGIEHGLLSQPQD
ncbi:hypothetical protein CUR178_04053 [Leishmania enriettii]|uniref:Phosphoglycan beta 1,3 galactosyltransferase n=1 Tax=Leishmania enriettii TaxID=5663 RepID=A0A836H2C4_LEIEN|nr:hypothetical protein CUR178_04053 [Leishmania enriettii]